MVQTMIGPKQYLELFPFPETIKNLGEMLGKKDKFVATLQLNLVSWKTFCDKETGFGVIQMHQPPKYW